MPSNTLLMRLGELAVFEMGQSPSSNFVHSSPPGISFLQGSAEFGNTYPESKSYCTQPTKICHPGDILISVRAPVGDLNKADKIYCIGRGLAAIRFSDVLPEFGWHLLAFSAQKLRTVAQGTTFEAISKKDLDSLLVPHCSLPEQRRIAGILDTVDEAIQQTEAVIAKLKQIKTGLLHDLLTRGIDEHGQLRDPIAHPEQFKDSPLGRIPREWDIEECAEACREITVGIVVRPAQYYEPSGVPVLRSANVRDDGIDGSDLVFMSQQSNLLHSKSMLHAGDIVTVRTGYPGTSCVVPDDYEGANCVDILISRPRDMVDSHFLSAWINSEYGKGQVLRRQGGLAQQHFNVGELRQLLIPIPSQYEQAKICDRLNDFGRRVRLELVYRDKLRLLKRGLMHDLLTGRVRVYADEQNGTNP